MIIATVLSFGFFALYDHFFFPKTPLAETNASTTAQPSTPSTQNAPEVKTPTSNDVASSPAAAKTTETAEAIVVVKAPSYELEIDKLGRSVRFLWLKGWVRHKVT